MGKSKPKGSQGPSPSRDLRPEPPRKARKKGSGASLYAAFAGAVVIVAICLQILGVAPELTSLKMPPKGRSEPSPVQDSKRRDTLQTSERAAAQHTPRLRPQHPPEKPRRQTIEPGCVDNDESCESWARSGECDRNSAFMHTSCKASCHICRGGKPPPKKVLARACPRPFHGRSAGDSAAAPQTLRLLSAPPCTHGGPAGGCVRR